MCVMTFTLITGIIVSIGSGESMDPNIKNGDIIVSSTNAEYSVGDVVCFSNSIEESLICHRVIEINDDAIQTKGDNTSLSDPRTNKENVHKTVLFTIPTHVLIGDLDLTNITFSYLFYKFPVKLPLLFIINIYILNRIGISILRKLNL